MAEVQGKLGRNELVLPAADGDVSGAAVDGSGGEKEDSPVTIHQVSGKVSACM